MEKIKNKWVEKLLRTPKRCNDCEWSVGPGVCSCAEPIFDCRSFREVKKKTGMPKKSSFYFPMSRSEFEKFHNFGCFPGVCPCTLMEKKERVRFEGEKE